MKTIWGCGSKIKAFAQMPGTLSKGHVMSKRENDANNTFRPSDSPLTEHEKEQIALRKKSGTAEGRTVSQRGCQSRSFA
jgi:hypothetical protein